ncbi:MAG: baseplate J/gp47 family protein [Oscillospiraceae bacterium]|nr:baseplate J/gp47 family protein [Oscillospiraceae bacterium]
MYEHLTPEYIKSDILGMLAIASTREGSYTNTLVSAVAYEMWKVYQSLDAVVPIVYVDETSGPYIDKSAAVYGMSRKPGTKATADVFFQGVDGTVIRKGKIFMTADSLEYALDADVTISSGVGNGRLTAMMIGNAYNAPAGAIHRQTVNQSGIDSVVSSEAIGGTDEEGDKQFVERYDEYRRRPPTSGNASHFRQWALEVSGVGDAKVIPLWNGAGTVKVLIVGERRQPVDVTVVDRCAAHIELVRPIGADVAVVSASGLGISVDAQVSIKPDTDVLTVQAAFSEALGGYLEGIAFKEYNVSFNRIGYILLDTPGVIDFTALSVNGGAADVAIADDEVPVVGSIGVTI